jgi:hypothetical protein
VAQTLMTTFLLVLLFFSVSSRPQETPPKSAPSAATKSRSTVSKTDGQKKTKDSDQDKTKAEPIPFCVPCPNCCPVEQPHSKSKEEQAKADSLDRLSRASLWATIFGVVGGLIGLGFIYWQTKIAARAASAARDNADAVIRSERAWLFVDARKIEKPRLLTEKQSPLATHCIFQIKNWGKTPGIVVTERAQLQISVSADMPPDLGIYKARFERKNPAPFPQGDAIDVEANLASQGWISQIDVDGIAAKNRFLWLCGFIRYRDIFERENGTGHETQFCYLWETRGSYEPFWRTTPNDLNKAT